MRKQILYLENDPGWVELIVPELARYGSVKPVSSEHQFREQIKNIKSSRQEWPSFVVLEQRVRWTSPAPNMPVATPEVITEGYANAGVRCYEYLRQVQEAVKIPVIFYTFSEPRAISSLLNVKGFKKDWRDYQCVEKDSSFDNLHEAVRKLL